MLVGGSLGGYAHVWLLGEGCTASMPQRTAVGQRKGTKHPIVKTQLKALESFLLDTHQRTNVLLSHVTGHSLQEGWMVAHMAGNEQETRLLPKRSKTTPCHGTACELPVNRGIQVEVASVRVSFVVP